MHRLNVKNISLAIVILTVAVSIISCKSDAVKQQEATQIAQERFTDVDTTTVDVYPQFENCDELDTTPDCFYRTLKDLVQSRLTLDSLQLEIQQQDSLVAQFTVSRGGVISFDHITHCAQHLNKEQLEVVFARQLNQLPIIDSALKQGIPVASSYILPIIVKPRLDSYQ